MLRLFLLNSTFLIHINIKSIHFSIIKSKILYKNSLYFHVFLNDYFYIDDFLIML